MAKQKAATTFGKTRTFMLHKEKIMVFLYAVRVEYQRNLTRTEERHMKCGAGKIFGI